MKTTKGVNAAFDILRDLTIGITSAFSVLFATNPENKAYLAGLVGFIVVIVFIHYIISKKKI